MLGNPFNPAVHAQRQSKARRPDRLHDSRKLFRAETGHVQDRSELLAAQLIEGAQLEQVRREEVSGCMRCIQRACMQQLRLNVHSGRMRAQAIRGRLRYHGPYVGRHIRRIADHQALHGTHEHLYDPIGNLILQIQHSQRRTPLTGAREGRRDDVIDDLLG